ncbi:sensor histidine kinase [Umezakia ovalisporum]|jgi:two-component system phosphate regulon sensor histidine kinase PhoR|uniref:histidine kinase n=2 Tax=Umezakia ovalisporum TaxID=75695 RepID=A0AA43GZD5_9CYAN|nr:PAS domain-containing sensor histidine kinase [Umezakia ovalisporum]MDH6056987.1 PAS domain-containing sensor histidine kinase [Umezakia ovalisporum FSS-43]MDH6064447.1 PAS domain-containing sensor histidine kinase [Umezakia ovalisporum FSS-62]MDH6068437.1 PAS domain-containing sensor histidine kinase [Umezakia ovalisporum APH033B]MDH6071178.1 PAS domain-containing sensor histidine kinase [Umezakia ovalisporum CobakiLakeA]MDH6074784.1 PAS domain-containing sensor histidine kinase [Umezakia 
MLLLGFFLGLAVGIGFWIWQQVQLKRYLGRVLQPSSSGSSQVMLPLMPRLQREIATVKQQRQDLQQSLQTYQDLLDFAPLGYLQVDEENQLLWCNQQAREILYLQRWQPGQVRLLLELVRSYELDQLIEHTRDWQQPQTNEWVFHPSCDNAVQIPTVKSLTLRASSLPLPHGQVGVFLENRQPLLDVNQERDRSFSDLAHELRTPLTSIRLVVETLQNRLDPPLDRWVNRLMQEVDRLINLVQSWLELTQMEANPTMQLHSEILEVRSLIASVWETLEPLTQKQHLLLDYSGPESLWIKADPARIYQVFLNLLANSIKYSPPGTSIQIQAKILAKQGNHSKSSEGSVLEINLIDCGLGFSETDLPYVFERFYRGDKARTHSSLPENNSLGTIVGNGLGLSIVRQIIVAHGGSIKAMNHPQTGGAWMQFQLPEVMANRQSQDYI